VIIRPGDVHDDAAKARLGVGLAAEALGIECNLKLQSMWKVEVDGNDAKTFLEFARDFANNPK